MSKTHVVMSGDTLSKISTQYYGVGSNYPLIIESNPILGDRKNKGVVASDGSPIIYPGDNLIIPLEEDDVEDTIKDAGKDEISIIIDKKRLKYFTGFNINLSVSSFDSITLTSPTIDNKEYDLLFSPFGYRNVSIYYGKNLFLNSVMISPTKDVIPTSKTMTLVFYPKCGVLADCPLPSSMYPVEFNNLSLKEIAERCSQPFGIEVEFIGDPGENFEKVGPTPTQKVLDFLIGLAKERGFLITNNRKGNLLVWKPGTGSVVSNIKEGYEAFISCKPTFNQQIYYSSITGISVETEKSKSEKYTWINSFLKNGVNRPQVFEVIDSENIDIQSAVEAYAGRMFGAACKYELALNSHRDSKGDLYWKDSKINLLSKSSQVLKETDFLFERTILERTPENGDVSILSLVLPGAYTGELPEDVPWEA